MADGWRMDDGWMVDGLWMDGCSYKIRVSTNEYEYSLTNLEKYSLLMSITYEYTRYSLSINCGLK